MQVNGSAARAYSTGCRVSGSVRICNPERSEDTPLEFLHTLGIDIAFMSVTKQVKYAVNRHVGEVITRRLALFGSFARNDRCADHEVAEQSGMFAGRGFVGKAQDVGGVIKTSELAVEAFACGRVDDQDIELGPSVTRLQIFAISARRNSVGHSGSNRAVPLRISFWRSALPKPVPFLWNRT